MTSTKTPAGDASVTEISTAKGTRKPRNRTARAQQLAEHAALAASEANVGAGDPAIEAALAASRPAVEQQSSDEPLGESLTDDERAQLKAHTDQLAAERAAAEQSSDEQSSEQSSDEQSSDEPAAPKPARARVERVARVEIAGDVVPAGYLALKSTPSYQQFRKAHPTAEGDEWLTRCAVHGTIKGATNRKAGRALGSTSERVIWCKGCKADAAKAASAAAKAKADKAAAAAAASDAPATSDEPTVDELSTTPAAIAEAQSPEPTGSTGPR